MEQVYQYTHSPIVKRIFLAMLIPTVMMNLTTSIASMADSMIIGHYLDDSSLSVVTFAMPIFLVINALSALFAVGGCIAMSIDTGKGNRDDANRAFSTSIELLVGTGMILLTAGLFFSHTVTRWLGAEPDVFDQVQVYARIIMMGAPLFTLSTGLAFFVRNEGRATLSMVGMFSSIAADIILNFVFVGFMDMGVAGAAYSTAAGRVVGVVILLSHFFSKKNTLRFHFTLDGMVGRLVKNGGSAALQFVYQFAAVMVVNHLLTGLAGTDGVVVYTVVFNLATVALSIFEGISQTIQPMVGSYYGEKSYRKIRETMRLAMFSIFIICGIMTLLLELWPRLVPMLFGIEDPNLIRQASLAVRIYAAGMMITTINVVIGYYLQSIEQSFMAAVMVSLRSFVFFMGALLILGKLFGINGIWASYATAEVLTFLVCLFMIRCKRKKEAKAGIRMNIFLLDESVESGIKCFTCDCRNDDFEGFPKTVSEYLRAGEYLAELGKTITGKKGQYIEVELNQSDGKAYIRDNLQHEDMSHVMDQNAAGNDKPEYGTVLGWNRLCVVIHKE